MGNVIMIFDDDTDILQVVSILLKRKGFEVVTENNCREVISKVRGCQPDIIVMDNWIQDTGGVQAVRVIKSTAGLDKIPVIFFSANNNVAMLADEAGADYFLQKPFDITDLEEIIQRAIDKKLQKKPSNSFPAQ